MHNTGCAILFNYLIRMLLVQSKRKKRKLTCFGISVLKMSSVFKKIVGHAICRKDKHSPESAIKLHMPNTGCAILFYFHFNRAK